MSSASTLCGTAVALTERLAAALVVRDAGAFGGMAMAFAIGIGWPIGLFGASAWSGETPFWHLPHGEDVRNALCGYWWFLAAPWQWPPLSLAAPNWPDGTNAVRFDTPVLAAVVGRLAYQLTGRMLNFVPLWVTACYGLNASALSLLVRRLGQQGLLAAIAAGAFAAMAPVIQNRVEHLNLLAQWLPIFMLALYFRRDGPTPRARTVLALAALAAIVHLYLYVMAAAIGMAIYLRDFAEHRRSATWTALNVAGLAAAGVFVLWSAGALTHADLADIEGDYRRYSMNLVSLFWPQTSGLFRWTGIYWLTRGVVGAMPGQYEGFCYLGGGALLLLVIAGLARWRDSWSLPRRHLGLAAVLSILVLWALSDRIWFGPYLVFSYEAPDFLSRTLFAWFRSAGRFVWPLGWLLVAFGLAGTLARLRPIPACCAVAIALSAQWIDTAPWRDRLVAFFSEPMPSIFGDRAAAMDVERRFRETRAVVLRPAWLCGSGAGDYESQWNYAAMEVQLMAARANARMRALYLSRAKVDYAEPDRLTGPRWLVVLHDPAMAETPMPSEAPCDVVGNASVCRIDFAP